MRYLLLTLFLFAGCTDAPKPERQRPSSVPRDAGASHDASVFAEHELREGETLWDLARTYDVRVDDIVKANRLRPSDLRRLSKGRKLKIPGRARVQTVERDTPPAPLPPLTDGAYHVLSEGQTLWDIARLYELPLATLLERNQLDEDAVRALRPGRSIIIPGIRADQIKTAPAREQTTEHVVHTLAAGETIWDLANAFGVPVSEIMARNGLSTSDATSLREGMRLVIPGVDQDVRGRVRRRVTAAQGRAQATARRLGLGTIAAAGQLLRGQVRREWMMAAGGREVPNTLRWPVINGWYVRGFGSGEGGYHLAMDIAGEIGWNVRAAAKGIVAYSGNEIRGYGNAVLVVHPGGWVTMYAHNSANYVVAGEVVPAGAVLAELGSTGISRGPHVHFEFMHEGKNCDPAPLLRPAVRHRNGNRSSVRQVTWERENERPDSVRCYPRRRHPHSRWVIDESPTPENE